MRYNYALPALALAGSVMAAPAVVTETQIVYVSADPTTAQASASHAPQVGAVNEVVVSKLVEVKADTTETHVTTFTRTKQLDSATTSTAVAQTEAEAEAEPTTTSSVQIQVAAASPTTSSKPTTTLTPTTTSSSAAAPATTSTQESTSTSSTSTSSSATTSSSTDSSFASAILNAHNEKRALHGVSSLTWSSTLEAYAQAYADKYDCSGSLTHSGGNYGENLGLGYTTTGVVDAWYDEISYYDWSNPSASHFTQVVWKSTTEVGCAYKTCGSYWGQYTICSYNPAGNVAGEYSENVLPLA